MSQSRMVITGMAEMLAALRTLPAELAAEGGQIVEHAATTCADHVRQGYGAHVHSGNLRDHVTVTKGPATAAGASMVVKSTAKHAFIFEHGTQARHTDSGWNRGAMPPFHVFIPSAIRARTLMRQQLIALVQRAGFRVSGQ